MYDFIALTVMTPDRVDAQTSFLAADECRMADWWKHGTRVCVVVVFFLVYQAAQHVLWEHLHLDPWQDINSHAVWNRDFLFDFFCTSFAPLLVTL